MKPFGGLFVGLKFTGREFIDLWISQVLDNEDLEPELNETSDVAKVIQQYRDDDIRYDDVVQGLESFKFWDYVSGSHSNETHEKFTLLFEGESLEEMSVFIGLWALRVDDGEVFDIDRTVLCRGLPAPLAASIQALSLDIDDTPRDVYVYDM